MQDEDIQYIACQAQTAEAPTSVNNARVLKLHTKKTCNHAHLKKTVDDENR